jgi:hypothetical protein
MIYFGYCTLLDAQEMRRLCPSAKPIGLARLVGYRLCFSTFADAPTQGACNLERVTGHEMWGLLCDMDEEEYDALDLKAGVDKGYLRRIEITVTTEGDEERTVTTYANPPPAGPYRPSAEYTRPILAGAKALALPAAYVEELEHIVATSQR